MKATKKIVGAACALVAAVALAAGSTFAWFTSNNDVTAKGMQVKAASADSLMISADDNEYKTSMELATLASGTTMNPVTPTSQVGTGESTTQTAVGVGDSVVATSSALNGTSDASSLTFYLRSENNPIPDLDKAAATETMADALSDTNTHGDNNGTALAYYFTEDEQKANYVTDDIYLKYNGELTSDETDGKKVYLGIEATVGDDGFKAIDQALHIGILVLTNTTEPDNESNTTTVTHGTTGTFYNFDVGDFTKDESAKKYYFNPSQAVLTLQNAQSVQIVVYAWYEGEDGDCKTANVATDNGLTINLTWSLNVVTSGSNSNEENNG